MDFDWKAIAGPLIKAGAPAVGNLLGGPLGGLIGNGIGEILGNALGVEPTPEAVGRAIENDPDAAAKLQAAESEVTAKYGMLSAIAAENSKQADVINATMQAEVAKGMPWYHWRNLYGYSVQIDISFTMLSFFFGLVFDPETFNRFMLASGWLMGWFTLRFGLLGYIQNQTSQEKVAAVTGQAIPTGVIGNVIKSFTKK